MRESKKIISTTVERERKGRIVVAGGKKGKRKLLRKQYMIQQDRRNDVRSWERR